MTRHRTDYPPTPSGPLPSPARTAVRGAWLGLFVDYFDIYLPIVALAPATIYFIPTSLPPGLRGTLTLVVFATSFLGRPLGSLVFGSIADTLGRRRTTLIAGIGTGTITLLTAALPGHAAAGVVAPILLIASRLLGGIFMGGQYTGANPLAMEQLPTSRRGVWGAVIAGAYPIAFITISIVTYGLLAIIPAGGPDSPYATVGWRIPFVIGGLLTLAFVLYFHRNVAESTVWERTRPTPGAGSHRPIRELLSGPNQRIFLQVFLMMTGLWMGLQLLPAATPQLLIGNLAMPAKTVTLSVLACNVVLAVAYPAIGWLGQRFSRRRMLILGGVLTAAVTAPLYAAMIALGQEGPSLAVFGLLAICLVLTIGPNAMTISYLCERFPTSVRAIGYGSSYSLPVIIPSFYAFMMLGVAEFLPYQFSPVPLLVLGGALMAVGAAIGPSTNHVDFGTAANPAPQGGGLHDPADAA